jgi:hypothetical protein
MRNHHSIILCVLLFTLLESDVIQAQTSNQTGDTTFTTSCIAQNRNTMRCKMTSVLGVMDLGTCTTDKNGIMTCRQNNLQSVPVFYIPLGTDFTTISPLIQVCNASYINSAIVYIKTHCIMTGNGKLFSEFTCEGPSGDPNPKCERTFYY